MIERSNLLDALFGSFAIQIKLLFVSTFCSEFGIKMSTLDVARAELALAVLYLNKAEARDKICRAIQYGSKFLSDGKPGTAQNVDKSTSLARKVFRLFKVWFDYSLPNAAAAFLSLLSSLPNSFVCQCILMFTVCQ